MTVKMRYGRQGLDVELPGDINTQVLHLNPVPQLTDPGKQLAEGLQDPIGTPTLAELAAGRSNGCIVISDITRPVPNELLVAPLLAILESAGLGREDILILVATGLHREATEAEVVAMLGRDIAANYRV